MVVLIDDNDTYWCACAAATIAAASTYIATAYCCQAYYAKILKRIAPIEIIGGTIP